VEANKKKLQTMETEILRYFVTAEERCSRTPAV